MVMGEDSHSSGRGFESQHRKDIFHIYRCKNCNACLKETEDKWKIGREWSFLTI